MMRINIILFVAVIVVSLAIGFGGSYLIPIKEEEEKGK